MTTALNTLQALAADPANRGDLAKFTVFIRGVLDFAERLSVDQVTTLFTILCQLTVDSNVGFDVNSDVQPHVDSNVDSNVMAGSGMINELFILVRKYLGMKDTNHQKMGVLGCCAILRFYQEDEESTKNLFLFCLKSTRNLPEVRLFFYQQLILSVESNQFPDSINRVYFSTLRKA